ncbi:MAG: hypothetical protein NC344_10315 [Bacteroidales bacterium]|nr:hypothetical protein [Bacteroidales bacterium]MCM1148198.1 hypothetical protein [Bacteroidales bacterium]MCM1207075.1 hypothetical protein [Bacillota bacterium]MCM1510819.1 hypothetical protein [Clostridium sp.]
MKKTFLLIVLLVASVALHAQKEVTKFLGIPVDGTKSAMIQKLKEKGFTSSPDVKDALVGTFNGRDVYVYVVTNNGKVCRIMLADVDNMDETGIRIRFNTLCRQFNNNVKYIALSNNTLPDDEDISYNMSVKNKRYEASFCQLPTVLPELTEANNIELYEDCRNRSVWFMICKSGSKYYITMFYDNEYNRAHGEDL